MSTWIDTARRHAANVEAVETRTERYAEHVDYEVRVRVRGVVAHEEGEDQYRVWSEAVDFGGAQSLRSGDQAFVSMAHKQRQIAEETWRIACAAQGLEAE